MSLRLEQGTLDIPRESLSAKLFNYAPGGVAVMFFVVYPAAGFYMWTDLTIYFMGPWGLLPIFVVVCATAVCAIGSILRRNRQPFHPMASDDWIIISSRGFCVVWHMLQIIVILDALVLLPKLVANADYLALSLFIVLIFGLGHFLFSSYLWYWRCRHEKVILGQNESRYGHTVYVSIPVFKLCGHFVLIVDEHKYELRLDSSTRHRPIFSERPLHPGEAEKIRSSFGHHWFVVGWTHRQHRDIQAIFNGVMNEFGLYDRIHNNCRHFLQVGCYTILDATAVWHEDMLLVSPATFWFLPKMSIMLWRAMLREFFRWACAYLWGPDWESSEFSPSSTFFEDLLDHDIDIVAAREADL